MERRKTFRLHPETFTPQEVIAPLIEQHKLKADKPAGITLRIEPENLTVYADRTHFSNIVSNLLDNSVKYSPGEAQIDITCREDNAGSSSPSATKASASRTTSCATYSTNSTAYRPETCTTRRATDSDCIT